MAKRLTYTGRLAAAARARRRRATDRIAREMNRWVMERWRRDNAPREWKLPAAAYILPDS